MYKEQGLGKPNIQELALVFALKEKSTEDDIYFLSEQTQRDLKGIISMRD